MKRAACYRPRKRQPSTLTRRKVQPALAIGHKNCHRRHPLHFSPSTLTILLFYSWSKSPTSFFYWLTWIILLFSIWSTVNAWRRGQHMSTLSTFILQPFSSQQLVLKNSDLLYGIKSLVTQSLSRPLIPFISTLFYLQPDGLHERLFSCIANYQSIAECLFQALALTFSLPFFSVCHLQMNTVEFTSSLTFYSYLHIFAETRNKKGRIFSSNLP